MWLDDATLESVDRSISWHSDSSTRPVPMEPATAVFFQIFQRVALPLRLRIGRFTRRPPAKQIEFLAVHSSEGFHLRNLTEFGAEFEASFSRICVRSLAMVAS